MYLPRGTKGGEKGRAYQGRGISGGLGKGGLVARSATYFSHVKAVFCPPKNWLGKSSILTNGEIEAAPPLKKWNR